ncbi:MAG: hypothetical protein Q9166_001043 [cf. Caloplaca sp. 2 TL-2023]
MLVLPYDRLQDSDDDFETSIASDSKDRYNKGLKEDDEQHLQAVLKRLRGTCRDDYPNAVLVFALQAPMMLLTGSVPVWSDNAKIAVGFGTAGVFCIIVFATASFLIHSLFSSQVDHKSKMRWLVADL